MTLRMMRILIVQRDERMIVWESILYELGSFGSHLLGIGKNLEICGGEFLRGNCGGILSDFWEGHLRECRVLWGTHMGKLEWASD